jgi:2,4-diaminopentanoate dehydrogenase
MRNGQLLQRFTAIWFVSSDVETSDGERWEFRKPSGGQVVLQGSCPLDTAIASPVAPENNGDLTPGLTARRPLNAVPYVCDAPAGIQTTVDRRQIIARLR